MKTPDLELFTDASGEIGYGAYFKGAWFAGSWEDLKLLARGKSIEWKELYAIVFAAATRSPQWTGVRIKFHCDNLSVVHVWTNKGSRRSDTMSFDVYSILYSSFWQLSCLCCPYVTLSAKTDHLGLFYNFHYACKLMGGAYFRKFW